MNFRSGLGSDRSPRLKEHLTKDKSKSYREGNSKYFMNVEDSVFW